MCGPNPPNECWCRVDLFAAATSALSRCISKDCTAGGWIGDYSSAVKFYTSYCQGTGFTAVVSGPAITNAATTVVQNAPTGSVLVYADYAGEYSLVLCKRILVSSRPAWLVHDK